MKIIAMILTHNNEKIIKNAFAKIPTDLFDAIFISDDSSTDSTVKICKEKYRVFSTDKNLGYGGNAKSGLNAALKNYDFDYIVEIHGDGAQFDPSTTRKALKFINLEYDFIIGSRFINKQKTKQSGISNLRYYSNIILSYINEKVLRLNISEYHTGFRIYSKNFLLTVPWQKCGNGHIFSFETLAQVSYYNLKIVEVECECDYKSLHTSISIRNGIIFTFKHFWTMISFLLTKIGIHSKIFPRK